MPKDPAAGAPPPPGRAGACLAFANTLHWHASEHPQETLHRYEDLLAWAARQGGLAARHVESLARRARREPQQAARVYRRAIGLRESIYRILRSLHDGAAPARGDAQRLNRELQRALPHYRVEFGDAGPRWSLAADPPALDLPLWPIAFDSVQVLLDDELRSRIGHCADAEGCGWLFLDLSKNRSRRWCSIRECGNRAKQRRLNSRRRASRRREDASQ
jgi:predicted RNA-binding Zn ribbon-like protein